MTQRHRIALYSLIILTLAFNLSSHSHGYWPGDTWFFRCFYWLGRLSLELLLFYGALQLSRRYWPQIQHYQQLIIAIVGSSIPFTLASAMLDIATGRPDTYAIMVELQNTGIIGTGLWMEWIETLARHAAFCGLFFVIDYHDQTVALTSSNNSERKTTALKHEQAYPLFVEKLSPAHRGIPLRIQAQEHYISITTEQGTELIQYRFGSAVSELTTLAGRQVHRSFWVFDSNVEGWQQTEQGIRLCLYKGEPVPVSRRFEQIVKAHYTAMPPG